MLDEILEIFERDKKSSGSSKQGRFGRLLSSVTGDSGDRYEKEKRYRSRDRDDDNDSDDEDRRYYEPSSQKKKKKRFEGFEFGDD